MFARRSCAAENSMKSIERGGLLIQDLLAGGVLSVMVFWIYGQIGGHQPIPFDDALYLTDNVWVLKGMSWEGAIWAFTNVDAANWHPITWLSHMLDQQIFGELWGGHMIENVFWHIGNSILVYVFFTRLRFSRALAFSLAAVFACHPLNVESVAWLSQRKTQISTLFLLSTILFYFDWRVNRSKITLALVVVSYLFSLMAKAMGVTLPVVILIFEAVDGWRLRPVEGVFFRERGKQWLVLTAGRVAPLFLASFFVAVITLIAQRNAGAVASLEALPYSVRSLNSLAAIGVYLKTFFWPTELCFFYPLYSAIDWVGAGIGFASLVVCVGLAALSLKSRPLIAFGVLWFLITLLPVIGLVQVGSQSHADRYMYVPMIGVLIAIGAAAQNVRFRDYGLPHFAAPGLIAAFAIGMGVNSYSYVMLWQNAESAYRNSIRVGGYSYTMTVNLTSTLVNLNCLKSAEFFALKAVEFWPERPLTHGNLATIYTRLGAYESAVVSYRHAVDLAPNDPRLLYSLGLVLSQIDKFDEAEVFLQKARMLLEVESDWRSTNRFLKQILNREIPIEKVEAKVLLDNSISASGDSRF